MKKTTATEFGEMFEEILDCLDEYEYPYCYVNSRRV